MRLLNSKYVYPASRTVHAGMGLLEVVISIAVLSVGLLGVAHMQAVGTFSVERSYQRSQATVLAYDIADRMRANPGSAGSYLSSVLEAADATVQTGCRTTTGCSLAQMVQNDLYEWNLALQAALPGAVGTITQSDATFTVAISWDDNSDGSVTADDPSFQVAFEL